MKNNEIIEELWQDWRANTRMDTGLCSVQTMRSIFELAIKRYIDYIKSSKPSLNSQTIQSATFDNPEVQASFERLKAIIKKEKINVMKLFAD